MLLPITKYEVALQTYLTLLSCLLVLASAIFVGYEVDWRRSIRFIQTMTWGLYALAFLRIRNDWTHFWNSIGLSGSILGVASLILFLIDPELHRIAGFFSRSAGEEFEEQLSFNEIGAVHALAIVLMLVRVARRDVSVFVWSALLLNYLGLMLVQSRSAFLALFLSVLAYMVFEFLRAGKHGRLSAKAIYAFVAVLGFLGVALVGSEFRTVDRIQDAIREGGDASIEERLDLWALGIDLLDKTDIWTLLVGFGSQTLPRLINAPTLDNFYLDHLLSEGVIGLALILLAIYSPLASRGVWANELLRLPLWGTALVAATVSLTGNVLVDPFYGAATIVVLWGGAVPRRNLL